MATENLRRLAATIYAGALTGTIDVAAADRLDEQLTMEVMERGRKFTKNEVGYIAAFPPPFFWEYRCGCCRFWESGTCEKVGAPGDERISDVGFCVVWLPPPQAEVPFSWLSRIFQLPSLRARSIANLLRDPFTRK
jgi:hypothetical protein